MAVIRGHDTAAMLMRGCGPPSIYIASLTTARSRSAALRGSSAKCKDLALVYRSGARSTCAFEKRGIPGLLITEMTMQAREREREGRVDCLFCNFSPHPRIRWDQMGRYARVEIGGFHVVAWVSVEHVFRVGSKGPGPAVRDDFRVLIRTRWAAAIATWEHRGGRQ